jgi:transcriptional regulator with XRE-family HTH domain
MTDQLRQRIGSRVKAARLQAGLSQDALADRIGRTPESISNIERGQQLPALDTLLDLAQILHIPIQELLDLPADDRQVSRQRRLVEDQIIETIRALSGTAVEIAAAQIKALRVVK